MSIKASDYRVEVITGLRYRPAAAGLRCPACWTNREVKMSFFYRAPQKLWKLFWPPTEPSEWDNYQPPLGKVMPTHGIDGKPLGASVMRRYLMGEWQYRNATIAETIDDAEPITPHR